MQKTAVDIQLEAMSPDCVSVGECWCYPEN